jgi:hypothetical protein
VTSCVAVPAEVEAKKIKLSPLQQRAIDQLRNLVIDQGEIRAGKEFPPGKKVVRLDAWKERLERADILAADKADTAGRQWRRIRTELENRGVVRVSGEFVWLADKADNERT